jgi:hypothetical protein
MQSGDGIAPSLLIHLETGSFVSDIQLEIFGFFMQLILIP